MKKRILAMLLCALLAANISSCLSAPKNDDTNTLEHTDAVESIQKETEKNEETTELKIYEADEPVDPTTLQYRELKDNVYLASITRKNLENKLLNEHYLYVKAWETYYHFPYCADFNIYLSDVMLNGETLSCLLHDAREHPEVDRFSIVTFRRGQNEPEIKQSQDISILKKRFYEMPLVYAQFYNESSAVCMFFEHSTENGSHELVAIMKTEDGGESWHKQELNSTVSSNSWHENIQIAEFITPMVGIITYRCISYDDFCFDHMFLTADGGKTWNYIRNLPFPKNAFASANIMDLKHENNTYILSVTLSGEKIREIYGAYEHTIYFQSVDLINWTLVE